MDGNRHTDAEPQVVVSFKNKTMIITKKPYNLKLTEASSRDSTKDSIFLNQADMDSILQITDS